jgi:hypothetical protein
MTLICRPTADSKTLTVYSVPYWYSTVPSIQRDHADCFEFQSLISYLIIDFDPSYSTSIPRMGASSGRLGVPGVYFVRVFVSSKDMDMCQTGNRLQALLRANAGTQNTIQTKSKTAQVLTGGLTNQAVSHSRSFQVAMINLCTSNPARCTATSSSAVPRGLRIKDASVTPQSERAGRQAGSSDGDGGGEFAVWPVKPHKPSCSIRGLMISGRSGGRMGKTVHIK